MAAPLAAPLAMAALPLGRTRPCGPLRPGARLPCLGSRAALPLALRPFVRRAAAPAAAAASAAALPGGASFGGSADGQDLASAVAKIVPLLLAGAAAFAAVQSPALLADWLQPEVLAPGLAVAGLGLGLTLVVEASTRAISSAGRTFSRLVVQLCAVPALAFAASTLAGLPLLPAVWLCLAGSCLATLPAAIRGSSTQQVVRAAPAAPAPSPAARSAAMLAASPMVEAPVELKKPTAKPVVLPPATVSAAPAGRQETPASVAAFINRWGQREGIEAAAISSSGALRVSFAGRGGSGTAAARGRAVAPAGPAPGPQPPSGNGRPGSGGALRVSFANPGGSGTAAARGRAVVAAAAPGGPAPGPQSPSDNGRPGSGGALRVSFAGRGGSGTAAARGRAVVPAAAAAAAPLPARDAGALPVGHVKEAVAKLEQAFQKPSAAPPAPQQQPRRLDGNSLSTWGRRRAAGAQQAVAAAATAVGNAVAAGAAALVEAHERTALNPFSAEARFAIANSLISKWSAQQEMAPGGDGSAARGAAALVEAFESKALDPFDGDDRLRLMQQYTARWAAGGSGPAPVPAQAPPAPPNDNGAQPKRKVNPNASTLALIEAHEKLALEPFAGFDRLRIAQQFTNLWSSGSSAASGAAGAAARAAAGSAAAVEAFEAKALDVFDGADRLAMMQRFTQLWGGSQAAASALAAPAPAPAPSAPQPAAAQPAVEEAAQSEVAPAPALATVAAQAEADRLALAPASVQGFITRWGTREGIEAAAAAAPAPHGPSLASQAKAWLREFVGGVRGGAVEAFVGGKGRWAGNEEAKVLNEAQFKTAVPLEPAAAARLAQAPASVEAFIARWGTREGIEAAAANPAGGAAAEPADFAQVVKTVAKWTGLEASAPGAAPAVPVVEPSPEEEAAARLAQAPHTVQHFISRWGKREGIEAANRGQMTVQEMVSNDLAVLQELLLSWGAKATELTERAAPASPAAPAVPAAAAQAEAQRLGQAPPSVQAFITRWGSREGIEAAAAAAAARAAQERAWRTVGEQAHAALMAQHQVLSRWKVPATGAPHATMGARWRALMGMDEAPGLDADRCAALVAASMAEAEAQAAEAARAARAPPSVQAFIARWGSRGGIEVAAAAAAPAAPATPAAAPAAEPERPFLTVGQQAALLAQRRPADFWGRVLSIMARWTGLEGPLRTEA